MKSTEVRQKFIEFFQSKGHTFVPSSSTIPIGDQTILFTIAGMAQFKAALTGEETRAYKRATNSQKCVRIGDLDDVGKDGRHNTMFEMLGSWSFGDYYKKEAIEWAFEFVKDVLKMDMARFWATVHHTDDEAFGLWKTAGVPEHRIVRLGDKDNFWAMGPTGPCGPCTELYLDQGEAVGKCAEKNFPCKKGPGCDCDRYLEFWNLVFMQFNRQEDGTLQELPFKSVDTGAGLERLSALLQGKNSNFEIDSFLAIKGEILRKAGIQASLGELNELQKESVNVVADHVRTLTFTLADGANFSNEGRGYVLRRVLRRAVRHAHRLNPALAKSNPGGFLSEVVPAIVGQFGEFYPEIREHENRVKTAIQREEARFLVTLENGLEKFNSFVEAARASGQKILGGEQVFALHDTFGFPSDLTRVLCEEIGFRADLEGFAEFMQAQKEKSKAEAKFYKFDQDDSPWVALSPGEALEEKLFAGYGIQTPNGTHEGKEVFASVLEAPRVRRVRQLKNRLFELVLARTPFYPEGGGQVADSGWIRCSGLEFELVDVRRTPAAIVHLLKHPELSDADAEPVKEEKLKSLFSGQVHAVLDLSSRLATARNHTATHLLHKALQIVLGEGVRQAGSQVSPRGLRFDFSHDAAMTPEQIRKVETLVNREILRNGLVKTHENIRLEEARKMGAVAIFDEKYEDYVRVLEVPEFSMELCGGTHVTSTGSIGLFKLISEGSVTSGVRRIEAVTGLGVYEHLNGVRQQLRAVAEEAKCAESDLVQKVAALRQQLRDGEKTIGMLQSRLINAQVEGLLGKADTLTPDIKLVSTVCEADDPKEVELLVDRLKERGIGIVAVGANVGGKAVVLVAVNPTLTKAHKALSAGTLVKQLSELVDGKGGGRPDFARGGGQSPEKLPAAIAQVGSLARALL